MTRHFNRCSRHWVDPKCYIRQVRIHQGHHAVEQGSGNDLPRDPVVPHGRRCLETLLGIRLVQVPSGTVLGSLYGLVFIHYHALRGIPSTSKVTDIPINGMIRRFSHVFTECLELVLSIRRLMIITPSLLHSHSFDFVAAGAGAGAGRSRSRRGESKGRSPPALVTRTKSIVFSDRFAQKHRGTVLVITKVCLGEVPFVG